MSAMFLVKFKKAIALIRFVALKPFFLKSNIKNFIFSGVLLQGLKKISIGNNNSFLYSSQIIIDDYDRPENIHFGNNNIISAYAILKSHGGYISLGDNNFIGERTQVQGCGGVDIGNHCLIAANTFISSSNHNFKDPSAEDYLEKEMPVKTIIEDHVWIGANCVIVAGCTIGHHSIIAAGTVLTKNVEPYTMVAGNPGRVIKRYTSANWERVYQ